MSLEKKQESGLGSGERANKNQSTAKSAKKKAPKQQDGFFARTKNYLKSVKSELYRVVWPTKSDVLNYTLIVVGTLIFFAVFIWIVDSIIIPALVAFSGLR